MRKERSNEEWRKDLTSEGDRQEEALVDLRELLLRAALYFFHRSPGDLDGLDRQEIVRRAEDCAQDALVAVTKHLDEFRGDSKFTTWAYKFAINIALMAARRERWKGVSLDELETDDPGELLAGISTDRSEGAVPELSAMRAEVSATIQQVIESELTDKQRQVLVMMSFHDVPLDEVVRHLDTNRNAVYKLLHDARKKLKSGLQRRGFEIGEALSLFSAAE